MVGSNVELGGEPRLVRRSSQAYIFEKVENSGLDPHDFEWDTVPGRRGFYRVNRLAHVPTGAYVTFDPMDDGQWWITAHPGSMGAHTDKYMAEKWGEVLVDLDGWLKRVRHEHDSPDHWSVVRQSAGFQESAGTATNEPFTPDERADLGTKLDEIESLLRTMQHTADDRHTSVMEQIEYLRRASERLGKKDWTNAAIGSFGGAIAGAGFQNGPDLFSRIMAILAGGPLRLPS